MSRFATALAAMLLIAGCSRSPARPLPQTSSSAPAAPSANIASGMAVPDEEPSEAELRRLEYARYEQINDAGGMPVTLTATGKSLVLHPKLYEVRKEKCTPVPQAPDGWYDCELAIRISLSEDGSEPSEQGERIGVKWDPKGAWVLQ